MLVYRSHCSITGSAETGYSFESRPPVSHAYYSLLQQLKLPGSQDPMLYESVSASEGLSVEEIGDQSKCNAETKRLAA